MKARYEYWMVQLAQRYPLALVELRRPPDALRSQLGPHGIQCRKGWQPLLAALLDCLEAEIASQLKAEQPYTWITQIKEKFGTLRVYVSGDLTDEMENAIVIAEEVSKSICEVCSAPARRREIYGLVATLCVKDASEERRRRRRKSIGGSRSGERGGGKGA